MTSQIKENEFQKKAPGLFKALKRRIRRLEETEVIINRILKRIEEAESLLNSNPEESKKKYEEVFSKIQKIEISHGAKSLAWKLFWIEIGYLVFLLVLAYATYKWPNFNLWKGILVGSTVMHLRTVWFGALGGISIAIYGIYEHIHLRDFDPQYELWYICKPLIGGIFGWFVYLIYYIGLVSVQGLNGTTIKTPELPYVIAFLAGFSERFTLRMIDKLMGVLTSWEEKPSGDALKKESEK